MATQHKITALRSGCVNGMDWEAEYTITFNYAKGSPDTYDKSRGGPGGWDPGWAAEVEFISISPGAGDHGAFSGLAQQDLESWASDWLQTDGYDEALAIVASDDESAREYAAELRADR